jgi:hypothetical protein
MQCTVTARKSKSPVKLIWVRNLQNCLRSVGQQKDVCVKFRFLVDFQLDFYATLGKKSFQILFFFMEDGLQPINFGQTVPF